MLMDIMTHNKYVTYQVIHQKKQRKKQRRRKKGKEKKERRETNLSTHFLGVGLAQNPQPTQSTRKEDTKGKAS